MSKGPTGSLFNRVFHRETDHGGTTTGDVLVLILDVVLLAYSGYWSWHFMQAPLPESDKILALFGLWGLDVGAVVWSMVWIFGSTTDTQDKVSLAMFVIDLIGMTVTSLVGFVGIAPAQGQADISRWVISIIIMLNIIVGFIYHMNSPQTQAQRKRRKMRADLTDAERAAELEIEREQMELEKTEAMLNQREALIARKRQATQQQLKLDGIERGLEEASANSHELTGDIAGKTRKEVENAARQGAPEQVDINKDKTTESEPPTTVPEERKRNPIRDWLDRKAQTTPISADGTNGHGSQNGGSDPNV